MFAGTIIIASSWAEQRIQFDWQYFGNNPITIECEEGDTGQVPVVTTLCVLPVRRPDLLGSDIWDKDTHPRGDPVLPDDSQNSSGRSAAQPRERILPGNTWAGARLGSALARPRPAPPSTCGLDSSRLLWGPQPEGCK